ncbi:MAG: nucleotide sugar dehydrogenase [Patescibacteria group bacterium]
MKLEELIKKKKAKITVIGLGYVGLPTAVSLAKTGYRVFGIDIKKGRVNSVNQGKSYISDVNSLELKALVKSKKLKAFKDFQLIKNSDIVIICVPTPLDKNKNPDISYMASTAEDIVKYRRKGQLIILESSTYPGTTREIILPILKKGGFKVGKDFFLAYSPERIDPGNKEYRLTDISRVVGGITKNCTKLATDFYRSFINAKVIPLSSSETAEMTKILENLFRIVNISMINELALLCGRMKIDIWEVIEGAKSKPYGFFPFYPSPKIGGHCVPLDPFYLSYKAKEYDFWMRFIELAGEINEQMPYQIMKKVIWVLNLKGKSIRNSKVLVWGVSYKRDIGDVRNSAAYDIIADLLRKGAKVDYFDPFISKFKVEHRILKKSVSLKSIIYSPKSLKKYDLVLILTDHSNSEISKKANFNYEEIAKNSKLIVDTRNAIKSRNHKNVFRL